jgi:hypothetical protein
LDFCEFDEELNATDSEHVHVGGKVSENIGQILLGERVRYSPYHVRHSVTHCELFVLTFVLI